MYQQFAEGSEDKMLVDVLAALAGDSSLSNSPEVAKQVENLAEEDSVLSQVYRPQSQEEKEAEQQEALEMSQHIWEGEENQLVYSKMSTTYN